MRKINPHTDLTRPDCIRDMMRSPLCEFDLYAKEKGSRKALYRFICDAPDCERGKQMIVGFGTKYKKPVFAPGYPNNEKLYSHYCTVLCSGFKMVYRPKGTRTC